MCCLDVGADSWGTLKPLIVSVRNWPIAELVRSPNLPFTPTELHSMSWPKSLINRL